MRTPRAAEAKARRSDGIGRRDFVVSATLAGAATLLGAKGIAQDPRGSTFGATPPEVPARQGPAPTRGLLYPQQNPFRNVLDLSGVWEFQLDPKNEGEARRWFDRLPAPRPIAVPCAWNDLYDDARDHLGLAWYRLEQFVPAGWRGQRVFLRIGSANYAARVWVNGVLVARHLGGHLPFAAEVTDHLAWDRKNVVAVAVENEQLPERVPPGPGAGPGGVAGMAAGFPVTTYDFFPYAGLLRPVWLYTVPGPEHVDDLTVATTIEGTDGVVRLRVSTAGDYAGRGRARVGDVEADLSFRGGTAEATLRLRSARLWAPGAPNLYPLTVTLGEPARVADAYTLDVGIRTVSVQGDRLLLNGKPIALRGFGKHEDFPVHGRGQDLPVWIRDYELLRWVGANSYRTSHYPYAEEAMTLADRLGFLVIDEIPAVGLNFEDPDEVTAKRLVQCRQQLAELVARDKNHPSVILWNVANEPLGGPPLDMGPPVPRAVEAGLAFFRELYRDARRLDPTRPVTMVGVQGGVEDWHGLFDVVSVNAYYGWYTEPGRLADGREALARELDGLHAKFRKPIVVTEFGVDTIAGAHQTPPDMWTEEYQVEFLRGFLDVAAKRPFVAGMHVWAFSDFKTGQGTMRAAALNHKGVFTRDRRPKAAAHFLRSRWTST